MKKIAGVLIGFLMMLLFTSSANAAVQENWRKYPDDSQSYEWSKSIYVSPYGAWPSALDSNGYKYWSNVGAWYDVGVSNTGSYGYPYSQDWFNLGTYQDGWNLWAFGQNAGGTDNYLRYKDYGGQDRYTSQGSCLSSYAVAGSTICTWKWQGVNAGYPGPYKQIYVDAPRIYSPIYAIVYTDEDLSYIDTQAELYAYLDSLSSPPPPPPPAPLSLRLPFRSGETWYVTQGNGQGASHQGNEYYAWDFNSIDDWGKPVLAPASGKIVDASAICLTENDQNNNCNSGWGNYVIIDYGNGKFGKLAHFRTITVRKGQYVFQGEQIGTCGSTGKSSGPHIHYQTQNSSALGGQSIASSFVDVPSNGGVPIGCNCSDDVVTNRYTSGNAVPVAIYHLDTTFDTSGNNNNTTANPSCIVAGCLNLNGTSNYLEAPDSPSLSITGVNLSMAGWLKTSSSSTQWIVSKYNNGASDASYGLYLSNGYVKFTVSPNGSTGGEVQSTVGVNDGNRRHVVVTYNGTDLTIYIDGAVNTWQSYFITNIFDSVSPLRIGAKNSQTAMEFFSEMLDEIVIYDRTLTADEVNNMYYSSKP